MSVKKCIGEIGYKAKGRRRGGGGLERRNRGMREGCNAETCQKRAPGPPCGMWPVCLPRKNRAGEREEREEREEGAKTSSAPSSRRERREKRGNKEWSYRARGRRGGKVRVQSRVYGTLLTGHGCRREMMHSKGEM